MIQGKVDPSLILEYLKSSEKLDRFAKDCVFDVSERFLKPIRAVLEEEESMGSIWLEEDESLIELKH